MTSIKGTNLSSTSECNTPSATISTPFFYPDKPIVVICYGPGCFSPADSSRVSYFTVQDDIRNAGDNWTDRETVLDKNWSVAGSPAIFRHSTDQCWSCLQEFRRGPRAKSDILKRRETHHGR
jgi:hypothetical protein